MHMHAGIELLEDVSGTGSLIQPQRVYRIRIRMWLNKGEPVRWQSPRTGSITHAVLEDEGRTLVTDVRIDRVCLINGLFYGIEGMCVGGTRLLRFLPQLGYGEKGIPDVIPPNSVLNAEVTILEERNSSG
jgi:hypothetical protein